MITFRAVALGVIATCGLFVATTLLPHNKPTIYGCKAEDMVEVVVVRASFDWHAGEHACVHIDNMEDGR